MPVRVSLDDRASYQRLDPRGMLDFAINFPAQLREGARLGRLFSPPDSYRQPKQVVVAGMGGSAAAGDLVACLCAPLLPIPMLVNRDYRLPRFVGRETLLIASSHSGNTEETFAATQLAVRRKARVVCITTGGKLRDLALRRRLPLIQTPSDPPMPPRAALGYSLMPLIFVLSSLGLYPGAARQVREAIALSDRMSRELHPDVPTERNLAKQLARYFHGRIPWMQSTAGPMSAAAYRWRCQFNENSKLLAYSSEYPELNHNEIVGWELDPRLARQLAPAVLRESEAPSRILARIDITRELLAESADLRVIDAAGASPLSRALYAVYLADFVTIYLAYLNNVDPAAMYGIVELKRRLAQLPA